MTMPRTRSDWLLWGVCLISLGWVAYSFITHTKPTQQELFAQLLGIGCLLIVIVRHRRPKK